MLWCSVVVVYCNMCRTGMYRFGIGNWIFLLATLNLFTYVQGGEDSQLKQDEGIQFSVEPSDAVAGAGEKVVLACGAGAGGGGVPLRLSWRHSEQSTPTRDHAISPQDKYRKQLANGSLVIENMSAALAGQYQCVSSSDVGTIVSRVAVVYLAELPELLPGPRSVLGVAGGPVLLPCGVAAAPAHARLALRVLPAGAATPDRRVYGAAKLHVAPPTLKLNVTWLKNGVPLLGSGGVGGAGGGGAEGRVTLSTSGALELEPARAHDAGLYRCRVALATQPHLYKTGEEIELRINTEVGNTEYPPRFIATPQPATVIEGASVTFDCAAVGNPKPEIIWLNNGVAIDLNDLDSRLYLVGSGSLRVVAARLLDAGAYTCRATSIKDSVDHTTHLHVTTAPRVQLASRSAVAARGGDVTLRCSVRGRPTPKVTWLKDGEPLTPNEHDIALVDGASLRILGVLGVDAGMWQCCAASPAGSAQAALRLAVRPPPTETDKNISSVDSKTVLDTLDPHSSPSNLNPSTSTQDIFNSLLSTPSDPLESDFLGETSSAFSNHPIEYDSSYDDYNLDYNELNDYDNDDYFHAAKEMDLEELRKGNASIVSAPKELKAVIVKHRFVTLSWEEPDTKLEDIKGYAVIYKVKGSERERVSRGAATKHEMNVAGLQPNTTYQFAVLAYTAHAASPLAQTLEVHTPEEEVSFGPPTEVRAEALGPHAIRVTWGPPAPLPPPAPAQRPNKYAVYYTEVESGREQVQWLEVDPTSPPSALSLTVRGVRAACAYRVRVAAAGGVPSTELPVTTPADVPAAPPANVTATPATAQSILVSWEAPPSRTHRGALTGYKIRYRPLPPTPPGGTGGTGGAGTPSPSPRRKPASLTTPADARRAELTGLEVGTTYQIRVCAMNAVGAGPFSEWVTATTPRQRASPAETRVPPPPPPLTTRGGRDWVSVWWGGGGGVGDGGGVRGYTLGWGLGVPDERSRELPAHAHSHVITGLEPNAEYVISLRASNALGLGPAVYATVRTKPAAAEGDEEDEEEGLEGEGEGEEGEEEEDDAPPLIPPVGLKVIMLSGTTAVVYWTDPTLPKGQTATDGRRYVVRWSGGGRTRTFNASDLNCMLDDLKPFTTYEFAVKLIKGGRESAWSMLVSNTTLEAAPGSPPRELHASLPPAPATPARAADLAWLPPAKPNGLITGYVITYAVRGSDEWTALSVGPSGRARVDRLRPRTAYLFKVQARNSKGLGPFSAPLHYTTPMESSDASGGGLATATSAWLWASAGGACAVLALAAALALSLCCRRVPRSPPHDTSTYQKASASAPVPPDLWIHHDQMELKHLDRPPLHTSNMSASSCEGRDALGSSTLTLRAPPGVGEYEPAPARMQLTPAPAHYPHSHPHLGVGPHPHHPHHVPASLDRRLHVPTYVAMTGVGVGVGVGVGSMSSMSNMGTLPSERRACARDQTPLLAGMAPMGSPNSSLASLHPPPAPCGSGTCPLGAACSLPSAGHMPTGAPSTGGGDIYACAARERGHYVAYEPLGHYTHRDSLSSEAGTAGAESGAGGAGAGGAAGAGGSLRRQPLHSFSDTSDHSTPSHSHSNRSVRESSPYKKSASSSPGHVANRLQLGGGMSGMGALGASEELEPLAPSRSTERLQQEVHTLEGLMKDLSAITQQQFHC